MVAARFKRDIDCGSARLVIGVIQRVHLSMRLAGTVVPALPDHFPLTHNDAPYPRVGMRAVETALRKLEGKAHVVGIIGQAQGGWLRRVVTFPRIP
jgi:hypothetical protein